MSYFFRSPSRRVCIIACITGGSLGTVFFVDSALRFFRRGKIPLLDSNDIVRVDEHARYPCKAFPGYAVVVKNYYFRAASDSADPLPSPLHRFFARFSNHWNRVVERGDASAAANQLSDVREVIPDARATAFADENRTRAPLIASALWPLGTTKFAALSIEPTTAAAVRDRGALRALCDSATNQSLVRCDPFAAASANCRADAAYLSSPYLRVLLSALLLLPLPLPPLRVAFLGVGGGALPAFLQRHFRRDVARLDLVDAEPFCLEAAVADLGTAIDAASVGWHVCDAAEFLREAAATEGTAGTRVMEDSGVSMDRHRIVPSAHVSRCKYDVVFVDLFVGSEAPAFVSTGAFLQLCRGALSPIGVVAFNLAAADKTFLHRCRCVFGDSNVFQIPVPASANVVVLARRADEEAATMSTRHFYRRAVLLQKLYALPYDLAAHYPILWRI